jgi:gliding motility-associated-like protein
MTTLPNLNIIPFQWVRIASFLCSFLVGQFITTIAQGQCNTTLNKLLPSTSVNNDDRFGSAMDANAEFMVIAAESSDTTGIYYGGAAYVYQKTVAGWAYRATLTASDPDEYDFFGNRVAIDATGNTIVIINRNYHNGAAYIFEKPATGWETTHETAKITFPEYFEFNSALDINDGGSAFAVSNPMSDGRLLYVVRRPDTGWSNTITPETLVSRVEGTSVFMGNDVIVQGSYVYASVYNDSKAAIHVYKDNSTRFELIAKLSTTQPDNAVYYFGHHLTMNGNTIAATGIAYESGLGSEKIFLFRKNGAEWTDMNETTQFTVPLSSYRNPYPIAFTSPTQMTAAVLEKEGDFYTGKVVEFSTQDQTWTDLTTTTLFEEKQLSIPSEFGNELIWNGNDLLMVAGRKFIDRTFRNAAISLTKSGGVWGSLQHTILPRKSGSNVRFGSSIVKTKEAMFVGTPYDNGAGMQAGAVHIYNHSGPQLVKVHTIYPSARKPRPTGKDMAFGTSVSVFEDEIAIGAPSFKYAEGQFGKIFLYKRTSADWSSTVLYDSLLVPEHLQLNHVGAAVVMGDNVLFASAYNNFADEHTNAVVIFEREDGKWTYKQLIKLGKPLDKGWPSVSFSLNDGQVAIGEFFTIGGGVSILNLNPLTRTWEITAAIPGDIFSGLGSSVKLLDNHLFVGAPGLSYNNVYRSGAVAVFTKLPGESWTSDIQASALIGAEEPKEGAFFGSSVDVIGNTLLVGAPGMFLTYDYQVRTIPGNTYVIQSKDYYWSATTQYLNLQGDRYADDERDYFGSSVTLDEEYFYISALNENTEAGRFSGAVYYIPTPPVIFLEPPICFASGPVKLKGYPFGGVWTGTGVDENGSFDPSDAGTGKFTLTYTTPNCNQKGTVQLEVKPPFTVKAISPTDVAICSEEEVVLEVETIDEAAYNWYYKPENGNAFLWLKRGTSSYAATNPGEYKAVASSFCSSESPVFKISIKNFPISLGPQPVVCSADQRVALVSSVSNGNWEGTGVVANQFNPENLSNGTYYLTFRTTTPEGCNVALRDSIAIDIVGPFLITQVESNFCETGAAELEVTPAAADLQFNWYYQKSLTSPIIAVDSDLNRNATVYSEGFYHLSASDGKCAGASNVLEVGLERALAYTLLPEENSHTQLCNVDDSRIVVESHESATYTWLYKGIETEDYQVLNVSGDEITISESGSYKVRGQYGFCSFESLPVSFKFSHDDDVFVPNVFTPNGDDKNQTFKVETANPISAFKIYNRYGREVYSNSSGEWTGNDASSGVYFWRLTYDGCGETTELKGWVHLLR